MAERPVVGVTGPDRGGAFAWLMTWLALRRAGGRAVRLVPGRDWSSLHFDALVLGGGSDIDPENYGAQLVEITEEARGKSWRDLFWGALQLVLRLVLSVKTAQPARDERRDRMERDLCRQALAQGLPVLGICRGAQMINIVLGGTLHQDTRDFYRETPQIRTILPRKIVTLDERSRLSRILGGTSCTVNALHNQAIDRTGTGLAIAAREANGVIQAIEDPGRPFLIGVQWHPEYLPQVERQQRLFLALVEVCRNRVSAA